MASTETPNQTIVRTYFCVTESDCVKHVIKHLTHACTERCFPITVDDSKSAVEKRDHVDTFITPLTLMQVIDSMAPNVIGGGKK